MLKHRLIKKPQPIDNLLKTCLGKFLNAIQDPDINVRRVALVTFNSAAHNKPSLVRDLLLPATSSSLGQDEPMGESGGAQNTLIQYLYNETKVNIKLIDFWA